MEIKKYSHANYTTLQPIGDLDAGSSIKMQDELEALLSNNQPNIHIDCSQLQYISSAGIGTFITHLGEIQSKGKLVFSALQENVKDVFQLLGLNQVVSIVSSPEDAQNIFLST